MDAVPESLGPREKAGPPRGAHSTMGHCGQVPQLPCGIGRNQFRSSGRGLWLHHLSRWRRSYSGQGGGPRRASRRAKSLPIGCGGPHLRKNGSGRYGMSRRVRGPAPKPDGTRSQVAHGHNDGRHHIIARCVERSRHHGLPICIADRRVPGRKKAARTRAFFLHGPGAQGAGRHPSYGRPDGTPHIRVRPVGRRSLEEILFQVPSLERSRAGATVCTAKDVRPAMFRTRKTVATTVETSP